MFAAVFLGEATLVELIESFTIRLSLAAVRTLIQSSPQRCCKVFDLITSVKLKLSTGVSGDIDIIIIHQKHSKTSRQMGSFEPKSWILFLIN